MTYLTLKIAFVFSQLHQVVYFSFLRRRQSSRSLYYGFVAFQNDVRGYPDVLLFLRFIPPNDIANRFMVVRFLYVR